MLGLALLGLGLGACGGAASPPAKSYPPGASGIEEALSDLDQEERVIAGNFGPLGGAGTSQQSQPYPQQPYPQQQYPQQPYPQAQPTPPRDPLDPTAPKPEPGPGAQTGASPPPPPAAPAEPLAAAPPDGDEGGDREEQEREDRCALACRSLGAMRRAADHVCRAAGSEDARCGRARSRVAAAEERVSEECDDC